MEREEKGAMELESLELRGPSSESLGSWFRVASSKLGLLFKSPGVETIKREWQGLGKAKTKEWFE